jgi:hypothetical protein
MHVLKKNGHRISFRLGMMVGVKEGREMGEGHSEPLEGSRL